MRPGWICDWAERMAGAIGRNSWLEQLARVVARSGCPRVHRPWSLRARGGILASRGHGSGMGPLRAQPAGNGLSPTELRTTRDTSARIFTGFPANLPWSRLSSR